jgi:Predicted dehydrogenases and related proteins
MKSFRPISRRKFLSRSIASAAATGVPLWFLKAEKLFAQDAVTPRSANDRPRIALVGCGGMGRGDGKNASRFGDIVAVCDVDRNHAEIAARELARDGKSPEVFEDFRKLFEKDRIDILVQATPDHWHTLVNLAAAQAGKDVYAEKPLTLTIDEGKHLIRVVREKKVVLQTGTQQRSSSRFRLACELIRNGRIGTLKQVSVFVPSGLKGGPFQPAPIPAKLNWDFWLGQAPKVDYTPNRCHANFRWWFEYSGGPVTDWGAHHNDIVRWALGINGPVSVEARPLAETVANGYTAPSDFEATLMWSNGVKQIVRTTPDDSPYGAVLKPDGQRNGIKFEGSDGWLWVNRDEISASDLDLIRTPLPEDAIRLERSQDHMANFFQCVRSRKDPIASVEEGHRSAIIGHLIVIALGQGRKLNWDAAKEVFVGDNASEANQQLAREMRKPYDYGFVG